MTSTPKQRGCDALLDAIKLAGVSRIFTLSGNHIMPVFDAALDAGIPLIHTRHEAATVHMADAFARITGEVGVALVTGGPGHANAVSALYTALMAESPIVLLSGHAPNAHLGKGAFQEMRQADMAKPVCKAAWTCVHADAVADDFARAVRIARSGRPGPVHLSLPTDVLECLVSQAAPGTARDFAAEAMPLDTAAAQTIMEKLRGARRPVILAGPSCMTRTGRARMAELQTACGIPVVGMDSPRGVADPRLGAFAQVLAKADAVLLLGKRLDFTLKFGQAPAIAADATVFQIDADPFEIARSRNALGSRLQFTASADVPSAMTALMATLPREPSNNESQWLSQFDEAVAWRPPAWQQAASSEPDRLHPVQMLRPLQAALDSHPDAVLVCDGGEIGQWASACLDAPHRVINGVAGAIGSALPYALAARCANPDAPVIAVMGDGTVGFHIAEFDTAVRYGLDFVAVVGNDARWNAEYQIQLRDYGASRLIGCELQPSRYDAVAVAFGGHGEQVSSAGAMAQALQRARDSRLPACLNVMIEGLPAPTMQRG
jgi:acetolactate synthase-1/2/3 large subunit